MLRLPFMLVVVDVRTPAPAWSALHDIEGEAAISTILMDGQMLGAGIIFLTPDRSQVPSRCTAIIEVDDDPEDEESAVFRYAETGFNTVRYVGKTCLVATQEKARQFSRHLEPLDIRRGYGSTLAATVTLLEMLNINSIDELQELARENWRRSMDPAQRRLALHRGWPALGQRAARADLLGQSGRGPRAGRRFDRFRQIGTADDPDPRHGA
jgi:hypothetical protein